MSATLYPSFIPRDTTRKRFPPTVSTTERPSGRKWTLRMVSMQPKSTKLQRSEAAADHEAITRLEDVQRTRNRGVRHGAHEDRHASGQAAEEEEEEEEKEAEELLEELVQHRGHQVDPGGQVLETRGQEVRDRKSGTQAPPPHLLQALLAQRALGRVAPPPPRGPAPSPPSGSPCTAGTGPCGPAPSPWPRPLTSFRLSLHSGHWAVWSRLRSRQLRQKLCPQGVAALVLVAELGGGANSLQALLAAGRVRPAQPGPLQAAAARLTTQDGGHATPTDSAVKRRGRRCALPPGGPGGPEARRRGPGAAVGPARLRLRPPGF
ncbi:hypothetical protein EYF80_060124 [Liparis tanakae]|uniref:Uncharacterized protein n=1 Tax=Liparis tanakae TaxID=230148 RepID=A0A4Z2EL91_9TELE|nr:hypothetical protein EYF80_060124 [Liparis tanakae]